MPHEYNHYIAVYTTVFAVMFNVMVFISQGLGAFKVPEPKRVLGLLVAVFLIVIEPVFFFAYSLPEVQSLQGDLTPRNVVWILWWVTPVYGFQQFWLCIAWLLGWAEFPSTYQPKYAWIFWLIAFAGTGVVPTYQLTEKLNRGGVFCLLVIVHVVLLIISVIVFCKRKPT